MKYPMVAFGAVFGALVLSFSAARGQAGSAAPGRVEQDTRPLPEPAARPPVIIERPLYPEQAPAGAAQVAFVLGGVQLVGNTVFPTESLSAIWTDRLGKQVSLGEAFNIAAAISARYRDAGYVLSQAVVPAQELKTSAPATLRIEILEGFVERATFTGIDAAKVQRYLAPVLAERPLKLATLERSLLLIGELAGVTAQANIKAGSAQNASDLEIVVSQSAREFSASVHNRSAPSQGRVRLEASTSLRGLLLDFDRHDLRLNSSGDKRLNLLSYSLEAPIGASGLKGQLSASASRSTPTTSVTNIDTKSDNLSVGLTYPALRSRQSSLGLRASFAGYNNSSETTAGTVSRDRIRALHIGLAADYADSFGGVSLLDIEAVKGFSRFGASDAGDPLLSGAVPDFSKATLYGARLQSLGGNWSLLVAATAQTSGSKLPTAEQLGLGGETFLRGYDPSEVIGENGSAGKLELRYNFGLGGVDSTLYAFGDSGQVRRKQTGAADQTTSLSSAGLGIRFSGPSRSRGFVEVAKPLHRVVASQGNTHPRFFGGLGIDF